MQGIRRILIGTVALTILLESITLILRFGMNLESTSATAPYFRELFWGYRVHHGYVGIGVLAAAWYFAGIQSRSGQCVWVIGLSLLLSDLIHHFAVLWPLVGDPQFDLVYPPPAS